MNSLDFFDKNRYIYYMQYMMRNPYTWLFLSALAGAIALALFFTRKRSKTQQFWIVFWVMITIGLGYWGVIVVGNRWISGATALWLYYLLALIFNLFMVLAIKKIYLGIFLVVACLLSLTIALDRWWINLSSDEAVVGIYNYAFLEKRLDLAILHRPDEKFDLTELAQYWEQFAPVANVAFSYASYPKGDIKYNLDGYLLNVPAELFFISHASYFYPISFSAYNSRSNQKKDPPLLICLRLLFDVREQHWHKEAPWLESTPVLFYSADFAE